jgi:hypothetical protein
MVFVGKEAVDGREAVGDLESSVVIGMCNLESRVAVGMGDLESSVVIGMGDLKSSVAFVVNGLESSAAVVSVVVSLESSPVVLPGRKSRCRRDRPG